MRRARSTYFTAVYLSLSLSVSDIRVKNVRVPSTTRFTYVIDVRRANKSQCTRSDSTTFIVFRYVLSTIAPPPVPEKFSILFIIHKCITVFDFFFHIQFNRFVCKQNNCYLKKKNKISDWSSSSYYPLVSIQTYKRTIDNTGTNYSQYYR